MLTLCFAVGITLFSCADKNEEKQKIEEKKIVKNDSLSETKKVRKFTGDNNPAHPLIPPPPPPKPAKNQVERINSDAATEIKTKNINTAESTKNPSSSSSTKTETQINAEFPGGIDQFHTFFMKEYKKPEGVSYWKLNFTLAFAVEKNGSVSFLECSPAVEEPLEKEIIRVLSLCPKWQPGELNGKKIKMQYSVPILLK